MRFQLTSAADVLHQLWNTHYGKNFTLLYIQIQIFMHDVITELRAHLAHLDDIFSTAFQM